MKDNLFCKHGELREKCPLCFDIIIKETRIEKLLQQEENEKEKQI